MGQRPQGPPGRGLPRGSGRSAWGHLVSLLLLFRGAVVRAVRVFEASGRGMVELPTVPAWFGPTFIYRVAQTSASSALDSALFGAVTSTALFAGGALWIRPGSFAGVAVPGLTGDLVHLGLAAVSGTVHPRQRDV